MSQISRISYLVFEYEKYTTRFTDFSSLAATGVTYKRVQRTYRQNWKMTHIQKLQCNRMKSFWHLGDGKTPNAHQCTHAQVCSHILTFHK
jgi:hypothetical protein